jgi:hypothetical protein
MPSYPHLRRLGFLIARVGRLSIAAFSSSSSRTLTGLLPPAPWRLVDGLEGGRLVGLDIAVVPRGAGLEAEVRHVVDPQQVGYVVRGHWVPPLDCSWYAHRAALQVVQVADGETRQALRLDVVDEALEVGYRPVVVGRVRLHQVMHNEREHLPP